MRAMPSFAWIVTGVTSFKQIMRLECAIDVIPSCAKNVRTWINVMIAGKLFVNLAELY